MIPTNEHFYVDTVNNPPAPSYSEVWSRTRLVFLIIVQIIIVAAVFFLYHFSYQTKFDELRAKVRDTTALLAISIDPEDVKQIQGPDDIVSPAFHRIHSYFRAAKNTQPDLQYIDIFRPPKNNGDEGNWTFVVDLYPFDTDVNGNGKVEKAEEGVLPGRTYEFKNKANRDLYENALLGRETSSDQFISDEWGTYISGFAPIYDTGSGKPIGLLEVDISHQTFQQKMRQIFFATVAVTIFFSMMATTLLHLLYRRIESMRFIQEMSQNLYELATKDYLTKVANRRHFYKLASHAFEYAKRHGRTISIMMLDVDHFKNFNDTYGHRTGDAVLQSIARLCEEALRTTDIIGRYGGEEFIIMIPEMPTDKVFYVAERLRKSIEEALIETETAVCRLTVSVGTAQLESSDKNLEAVICRADKALYEAKNGGRNRVVVSKPEKEV